MEADLKAYFTAVIGLRSADYSVRTAAYTDLLRLSFCDSVPLREKARAVLRSKNSALTFDSHDIDADEYAGIGAVIQMPA